MDNIEFLLQSLDTEIEKNDVNLAGKSHLESDSSNKVFNSSPNVAKNENSQIVADSVLKNEYDFEITKKQLLSKYSNSGNEINKNLKENERKRLDFNEKKLNAWKINKSKDEDVCQQLGSFKTDIKQDVYAEPVFGLRLINPIVSSSFIQSKMAGRHAVPVSNISYHLRCGDKNRDWVFAGAVVFKSGLKTSQKGSQYCFWKISDLKQDLKQVTLYLFGKACSELWKVSLGTVAAVLNATPFYKDEKSSNDEVTLTIKSTDQIMIWGGSRDYGLCKALKKNGEKCTSFVNKSACEFCIFHIKKEYSKFASTRSNLQAPSVGLTNLRNKVLGKSEVFYAGKSYTALNVPKRGTNDKRNSLPQTAGLSVISKKLRETDQYKLEKLNSHRNRSPDVTTVSQLETKKAPFKLPETSIAWESVKLKTLPTSVSDEPKTKTENCSSSLPSTKSSLSHPVSSRLSLFKQAGAKMLESGEVTRITAASSTKKVPCFSFADVLSENSFIAAPNSNKNAEENEIKKKVTLKKKENVIDLSVDIKKLSESTNTSSVISKKQKSVANQKVALSSTIKEKSKANVCLMGPSKILQDFKNLSRNSLIVKSKTNKDDSESVSKTPEPVKMPSVERNSTNASQIIHDRPIMKSLMRHVSSPNSTSNSIYDFKKARAKQSAINLIKRQGGLAKTNPNQVRSDPNKRKSLKRPIDNDDADGTEEKSFEKSVLSDRFVELMNTSSKHENLVQLSEDIERQDYFNKLEKKEQLEEKMLSTYKVPCKAVVCFKCKYKWFSASDLCRAEGHPIKVIDTIKRYFKCDNCTNRTVSLEVVPLVCCKQCGASKWSRAGMIKEKLAKIDNTLSIRGDEISFLDSLSHSMNINLLVPEDK